VLGDGLLPNLAQHAFDRRVQRAINRAAAGAGVAPAAELLGDRGDIELALTAKAHAKAAVGQFAKKDGNLNVAD